MPTSVVVGFAVWALVGLSSGQPRPAWASLDSRVSGGEQHRLDVLDARLELFLRQSVLTVAPDAKIGLTNPDEGGGLDSHGACDSYTVAGSRDVRIVGLSDPERALLQEKIVQLWHSLGISTNHASEGGSYDFVVVHGFAIEVDSRPGMSFHIGGSTPCLTNDVTLRKERGYKAFLLAGVVGGSASGGVAIVLGRRRRERAGRESGLVPNVTWISLALSILLVVYGFGGLVVLSMNRNI